jgi:hypothetical protein
MSAEIRRHAREGRLPRRSLPCRDPTNVMHGTGTEQEQEQNSNSKGIGTEKEQQSNRQPRNTRNRSRKPQLRVSYLSQAPASPWYLWQAIAFSSTKCHQSASPQD